MHTGLTWTFSTLVTEAAGIDASDAGARESRVPGRRTGESASAWLLRVFHACMLHAPECTADQLKIHALFMANAIAATTQVRSVAPRPPGGHAAPPVTCLVSLVEDPLHNVRLVTAITGQMVLDGRRVLVADMTRSGSVTRVLVSGWDCAVCAVNREEDDNGPSYTVTAAVNAMLAARTETRGAPGMARIAPVASDMFQTRSSRGTVAVLGGSGCIRGLTELDACVRSDAPIPEATARSFWCSVAYTMAVIRGAAAECGFDAVLIVPPYAHSAFSLALASRCEHTVLMLLRGVSGDPDTDPYLKGTKRLTQRVAASSASVYACGEGVCEWVRGTCVSVSDNPRTAYTGACGSALASYARVMTDGRGDSRWQCREFRAGDSDDAFGIAATLPGRVGGR